MIFAVSFSPTLTTKKIVTRIAASLAKKTDSKILSLFQMFKLQV